jgi:hypothetical protein
MKKTKIEIMGTMTAIIENSEIRFCFMPDSGDAGYFGDACTLINTEELENPKQEQLEEKLWELVGKKLTHSDNSHQSFFVCEWAE